MPETDRKKEGGHITNITNQNTEVSSGTKRISGDIRRHCWSWTGHVLRKRKNNDCAAAMERQPKCRHPAGRAKNTWRRTVEKGEKTGGVEQLGYSLRPNGSQN